MSRIAAIIPAAGLGTRMGAETPKQFLELDGMPLVIFALRRLAACPDITDFFIATRADDIVSLQDKVAKAALGRPARVVHGGDTRQQSVANALAQVDPATEIVLVHDAVRPFVTAEQIERVIAEARTRGAAILGIPAIDTVKEVKRASLPQDVALITSTIPRERIVLAQTPQAFSYPLLRDAFRKAQQDDITASDEASLVERFGHDVFVVLGSERNLKITRPADMDLGYDLHRLAEGRKLMIGGVDVPFEKGSVGHSDADVLAHALCDALLGAAGLGDIGTHFPDTDPKWKDASSLLFLEHARKLLDEKHLRIAHLDAVVICERPKLGPHFPAMRAALAKSLGIAPEQINLKAKTNEGTGEIGRGEAIAAHTIATLES
jgi:2-C-methyl-D-erythritol 4-phosphate cytidylyltransferase/2-C-methyl-D-erythritol 2,4-cyclodiphosphate synthase